MPATPYAKILVSVNGGANTSGGIDIASACTIDLTPESNVGWLRARWEWFDYPEGWATPAGWTLGTDGVIYYTSGFTPPQVTMPASCDLWGVWMPRLLVNEQIDDNVNVIENLLDQDVTALSMLSPSGYRDIGAREKQQFTTATTLQKRWLRSYQRNLRTNENPKITITTTGVGPDVIRRYTLATGDVKIIRAIVKVRKADGTKYGEYTVQAAYNKVAGVLAQLYAPVITTVVESDAGLNVTLSLDANLAVKLNAVGLVATDLTWEAQEIFF